MEILRGLWCVIHDNASTFAEKSARNIFPSALMSTRRGRGRRFYPGIVSRWAGTIRRTTAERMMRNISSISLHHPNGLPKHQNKDYKTILEWMKRGWFLLISNTRFAYSEHFPIFFRHPTKCSPDNSNSKFHSAMFGCVHEASGERKSEKREKLLIMWNMQSSNQQLF